MNVRSTKTWKNADTQIVSNHFFGDKSGYHTPSTSVNSTMMSSNRNIFHVTGPLWGECTGHSIGKMVLPHVDAITSGIVRGDIRLRGHTTQVIIGRVSTAPQVVKERGIHA